MNLSCMELALICITFLIFNGVKSLPAGDLIKRLPAQPNASFQQYAGFVTVDQNRQRSLFYYFVQAESDTGSKPLVLWFNGGPGCSSLGAGAFSEHGPFHPSSGRTLIKNDYSWNREANMLYLESPAGVGFSYSTDTSFYANVNDTITAHDNLMFLQNWFLKFPEYKNRAFYITGESYAGHYVPQLAQHILESGVQLNLKGIAIGNPLLDFDSDIEAEGHYYWSHGLVSDATYNLLLKSCNTSQIWRESITGNWTPACIQVNGRLNAEMPPVLDSYDVTADSCISSSLSLLQIGLATRKHPLLPRSRLLASVSSLHHIEATENVDVCVLQKTFEYLNRKDVQEALHARLVGVPNWRLCTNVTNYDAYNLLNPTIGIIGSLVHSGIRVLVYSGDQDSTIPFTSSRSLVNKLAKKLGLNKNSTYKPWFDQDEQVGGWTQVYGNNILSYATIRGASHVAPLSSPKRSLALFIAYLAGKPLA